VPKNKNGDVLWFEWVTSRILSTVIWITNADGRRQKTDGRRLEKRNKDE
jgi:hypothetical protein